MNIKVPFETALEVAQAFSCEFITVRGELIIDRKTNTYASLDECETKRDVEAKLLMAVSASLSCGDAAKKRKHILAKFNTYFNTNLTFDDMERIYAKLCYAGKLEENKSFIERGFPMEELVWEGIMK